MAVASTLPPSLPACEAAATSQRAHCYPFGEEGSPHTLDVSEASLIVGEAAGTACMSPETAGDGDDESGRWKADAESSVCDAPSCDVAFNLFNRRHHCRACGGVFCAGCSTMRVPLPELGYGCEPQRVCDICGSIPMYQQRTS